MTRAGTVAVAVVGWALMFGDDRQGWRQVDGFGSEATCLHEREVRAREVKDKAHSGPSFDKVLTYYKCVQHDDAEAAPAASGAHGDH